MEETEFILRGMGKAPWSDLLLNPRRLRGSDFLMRWAQGVWSEERLVQAVNATGMYIALPYGPSGTAPDNDIRAFELYFERLENAGLGDLKRPDLLLFNSRDEKRVQKLVSSLNGPGELPFTPENDSRMKNLLSYAIIAVECENSLWKAKQMPDYGTPLTPQRRLGGKPGLKKTAVLPTIIIKEEDRAPLRKWQSNHTIPIHLWHAFYDESFGISLDKAEEIISSGEIEATRQVFQAPGGATTEKTIFKIYYQHAYHLATSVEEPKLIADSITDKNGHILPYVRFDGGRSELSTDAIAVLREAEKSNA
ncbi:MAG: AccI family restriction endonuclease [bacterium]